MGLANLSNCPKSCPKPQQFWLRYNVGMRRLRLYLAWILLLLALGLLVWGYWPPIREVVVQSLSPYILLP